MSAARTHNHNTNHIALAVPPGTLDTVAAWYGKHFGFRQINSAAMDMDRSTPAGSANPMLKIYGDELKRVKIAFLTTGNGVGFEIFEFIDPPTDAYDAEKWTLEGKYQRGGFFHIGVTVADVEGKCKEVCEDGGKQVGETIDGFDGDKFAYLRDPWGNVVELCSSSWEHGMANRW